MKSISEFRIIEDAEYIQFQQLTAKFLKITLPLHNLKESQVYIYRNKQGAPVAGYLINDTANLRLMSFISRLSYSLFLTHPLKKRNIERITV